MPTFYVTVKETITQTYQVVADSQDEACENWQNGDIVRNSYDCEHAEVLSVEPNKE